MSQRAAVAAAAKVGDARQGVGIQPGQPHRVPRWRSSATTASPAAAAAGHSYAVWAALRGQRCGQLYAAGRRMQLLLVSYRR